MVSSIPMTSGPSGANAATRIHTNYVCLSYLERCLTPCSRSNLFNPVCRFSRKKGSRTTERTILRNDCYSPEEAAVMDLDTFIIAVFCVVDEAVPHVTDGHRLRQRGPQPVLADSEVITMEVVGAYLGLEQDSALFAYFRQHYAHFFPALRTLHRTTFARQAANLWRLKERLWQYVLAQVPHDPTFAIIDSFPLPVCQFARAYRCRRFRGEAAFGKDTLVRQTFYGMRVHVRLAWPGVITRFCVAPANIHELAALPALTEQTQGTLVGDRNAWSPMTA